jgi:type III restriction enzyme
VKRKVKEILEVNTMTRDHESISILGLKSGDTIFCSANYKTEIVIPDSLSSLNEALVDPQRLYSAFVENINPYLLKTPIDLVFTSREPERKFVHELLREENADKIDAWIKSRNQSFYSIEYSFTQGTHTSTHNYNPDFFIMIKDKDIEYISVIEIKSDDDASDENKQKSIYAKEHFSELNKQLEKSKIPQKYLFNFLSPRNYGDYFTYLRDRRLLKGVYKSELDNLLDKTN